MTGSTGSFVRDFDEESGSVQRSATSVVDHGVNGCELRVAGFLAVVIFGHVDFPVDAFENCRSAVE